jgi:hypothetical protein
MTWCVGQALPNQAQPRSTLNVYRFAVFTRLLLVVE